MSWGEARKYDLFIYEPKKVFYVFCFIVFDLCLNELCYDFLMRSTSHKNCIKTHQMFVKLSLTDHKMFIKEKHNHYDQKYGFGHSQQIGYVKKNFKHS